MKKYTCEIQKGYKINIPTEILNGLGNPRKIEFIIEEKEVVIKAA